MSGRDRKFVEVKGLDDLIKRLHDLNPKLEKALKKGLKESAQPVLQTARAKAQAIAYSGKLRPYQIAYKDSLSIASRQGGSLYVLKSTDPAAGVKEYAHVGATRLVGKSSRSSIQRKRKRARNKMGLTIDAPGLREVRVGVPRRANPPRVMIPAIQGNEWLVRSNIEVAMAKVLKEVENG